MEDIFQVLSFVKLDSVVRGRYTDVSQSFMEAAVHDMKINVFAQWHCFAEEGPFVQMFSCC